MEPIYERPIYPCLFQITTGAKGAFSLSFVSPLRSLPQGTRPPYSSLLAHAILFLALHDRLPAAIGR